MDRWIQIVLIITPGVWSGNWGVKFESQCALRGTSVILKCRYDYPILQWVRSVSWSKGVYTSGGWRRIFLDELPSPPDYKYIGNYWHDCSLQVNNVRSADEGRYYFSFVTSLNRWKSKGYAHLSVKELTAVVEPNAVTEGDTVRLNCESGCPEPPRIVLIRDGQRVSNSVFQARREDAGRYYCAVFGQETSRSATVTLNVYYAPKQVTLSVSPSSNIIKGGSVTVSCSSDANPPVTQNGYSLYKDGQLMGSGQSRVISDVEPSNSGWYHCQAWNSITWRGNDHFNSTGVHLDVQYPPLNISVSVEPDYITKGSSVNLTCSSAANPAADNHTWFKWTESLGSSSLVQVGSGPVLTLPSVEETHTGLYLCYVRNRLGENNSTVMMLVQDKQHGIPLLPVLAGTGVSLFVMLVIALLLFWKKQKAANKKETVLDRRPISTETSTVNPPETVYDNIVSFPSSTPPVSAISASQGNFYPKAPSSNEDEVNYSTVRFIPRKPSAPRRKNNSHQSHDSRFKSDNHETSVIYATVAPSR